MQEADGAFATVVAVASGCGDLVRDTIMGTIVEGNASGGYQPGSVPSAAVADDAIALEGRQESSALVLAGPLSLRRPRPIAT